jgi:hypothetical protein
VCSNFCLLSVSLLTVSSTVVAMILLIFLWSTIAVSQRYTLSVTYSAPGCLASNAILVFADYRNGGGGCDATACSSPPCTIQACTPLSTVYTARFCLSSALTFPAFGGVESWSYSDTSCVAPAMIQSQRSGVCVDNAGTSSTQKTCLNNGTPNFIDFFCIPSITCGCGGSTTTTASTSCTATGNSAMPRQRSSCALGALSNIPVYTTPSTIATTTSPTSSPVNNSSSSCFHVDTAITYKGQTFSMTDFETHAECRIPHHVKSDGVLIETTCSSLPLRLTHDHLVFTSIGLRAASTLRPRDILFADMEQHQLCHVVSVSKEAEQLYFGLNCLESIVLANGVKTSTFGKFHSIPSFWMKYVSMMLGVTRTSQLGDWMVGRFTKMNLI